MIAGNERQFGNKAICYHIPTLANSKNRYLIPIPQFQPHSLPQARKRNCSTSSIIKKSLKARRIVSRVRILYHKERPSSGTHREHSRPILEGAGEARNPCVVWQAGVTVARRQRRVQECLLRGVVSLRLVLLGLGQGSGRGWGGGIPTAKLCEVTCDRRG